MIDLKKLAENVDPDYTGILGLNNESFEIFCFGLGTPHLDAILRSGIFVQGEIPRWCIVYFGEKETKIEVFHELTVEKEIELVFPLKNTEDFHMGQAMTGESFLLVGGKDDT